MQQITIEQQETISFPSVQVLSSYVFLDGHTASYDMTVYNWIAEHTDTQGQATEAISYDLLHSVEMQVFIDSFFTETGHVPEQLITLIGSIPEGGN